MLSSSSAMSNPFDYRETMKSAFGYSDKTMEQLERERAARDKPDPKPARGRSRAAPTTTATPRAGELDKLAALMAKAKPRDSPTQE